jgi:MFS transporter, DHA1 family, staphyloferrin B biosynthesis exporter
MAGSTGVIRLLFAIQLVTMGAMEMSGPFWPVRLRALAPSELALTVSGVGVYVAPMLGIALTGALWGRLGDRYGHRAMMLRALVGLALTQLGLALASDAWTIVALRFVQGACAGFSAPAQAYGVGVVPPERRGRLFAFLQVSTNVGSLVGAVGGGLILDHASFFWINAGASALCVACALAVLALLPPAAPAPRAPQAPPGETTPAPGALWRNPAILGLLVAHGCLLTCRLMPQVPFALYVRGTFQVENWVVGLCYGLMAMGFVASAALWARAFEGASRSRALGRIAGVAAACALAALLAGTTTSIALFAFAYFAWGALLGATTPVLTTLISREAAERHQGQVLGIVQSTTQASSIAGIALGGLVNQAAGSAAVFPAVAALYLASCLFVLRARQAAVGTGRRSLEGRLT